MTSMFITLEGPDGSGKTSQVDPLAHFLRQEGYQVYTTREPGGTDIGDQVRAVIMGMKNTAMHPRAETLLFCASRAQLVEEVIRPHLAKGEVVICDRYADSTLAYQGYGHGRNLDQLRSLLDYATGGLRPDLTLLLDIDAEEGLCRRKKCGGEWNRLDDYELALHRRVRQGYLELIKLEPERWRVVDASQPLEEVQDAIRKVVINYLQ
jgi:dTMP kinase